MAVCRLKLRAGADGNLKFVPSYEFLKFLNFESAEAGGSNFFKSASRSSECAVDLFKSVLPVAVDSTTGSQCALNIFGLFFQMQLVLS